MNKELLPIYQLHHFYWQGAERLYLALMHMAELVKADPHHLFPAWHMEYTLGALEVHHARRIIEETWGFHMTKPDTEKAANDWRHLLTEPASADAWWSDWETWTQKMPKRNNLTFTFASRNHAKSVYQAICLMEQLVAQGRYVAAYVDPRTRDETNQGKYFHVLHAFGPGPLNEGGKLLIQGLPILPRPYRYDVEELITSVNTAQSGAVDAFLDTLLGKGGSGNATS